MSLASRINPVFRNVIKNNHGKIVSWSTIVAAIREKNIPVTNWMEVRNLLQGHIDSKHLTRTDDIRKEEYQVNAYPAD